MHTVIHITGMFAQVQQLIALTIEVESLIGRFRRAKEVEKTREKAAVRFPRRRGSVARVFQEIAFGIHEQNRVEWSEDLCVNNGRRIMERAGRIDND